MWNCTTGMAMDKPQCRQKQQRCAGVEPETLTWRLWPSITSPQPTRWGPVTGGKPTDWLTPISSPVEWNNDLGSAELDGWRVEHRTASCWFPLNFLLLICHLPPNHPSLSLHLPCQWLFQSSALLHWLCQGWGAAFVVGRWGEETVVKRKKGFHTPQSPLRNVHSAPTMCPAQE